MDTAETETTTSDSFAVEIGKSFVISAATTAGTIAGFVIVGVVVDRIRNRRKSHKITATEETK